MKNIRSYLSGYILTLIGLIVINIFLIISANRKANEFYELTISHLNIERNINDLEGRVLRSIDIGIRGYALTKDSKILVPFYIGKNNINEVFTSLNNELNKYDFDKQNLADVEQSVRAYALEMEDLKLLVDSNNVDSVKSVILSDPGYPIWVEYDGLRTDLSSYFVTNRKEFETDLREFQEAIFYVQIISLFMAGFVLYKMYMDVKTYSIAKEGLVQQVKASNEILQSHKDNLETIAGKRTEELKLKNEKLNQAYDELKTMQIELVRSEKLNSLSTLIAGVAHEINNPLNYINGGIGMIESHFLNTVVLDESEILQAIDLIKKGVARSSKIVKSLYSFEDRQGDFVMEDIHRLIDDLLLFESKKMEDITLDKEYGQVEKIPLRKGAITLVLMSILENAYYETSKVKNKYIRIRTERISDSNGEYVLVGIFNTGKSIEKDIANKIFDPFYSTKETGEGAGLGLSMALSVMKEHEGSINFKNINNGVEFEVVIPILSDYSD
ncbi:MAG: CHASE3 domain-containing protein [Cyclobacteriaceae bacterium]